MRRLLAQACRGPRVECRFLPLGNGYGMRAVLPSQGGERPNNSMQRMAQRAAAYTERYAVIRKHTE